MSKNYEDDIALSAIKNSKELKYSTSMIIKSLGAHSPEYLEAKFWSNMGCSLTKMV